MASSFQGGVGHGGSDRAELRALVAVHGSNLEALTGEKTFRIPLARCAIERDGEKIVVRDQQGPLVIWSDDEGFLGALEHAQRGTLGDQARSVRSAARRSRLIRRSAFGLVALGALAAASLPITRWAVAGGMPSIADKVGASTLERLALPSGLAPAAEQELHLIAARIQPVASPPLRTFRLLLADYAEVHGFSVPPSTVVVTSGLVCVAEKPDVVMAVVARELAHLETHDLSVVIADSVDWQTAPELLRGDVTRLRARMLDFADLKRLPTFSPEQETAALDRAHILLSQAGVSLPPDRDFAALMAEVEHLQELAAESTYIGPSAEMLAGEEPSVEAGALVWAKARAEACELIGR